MTEPMPPSGPIWCWRCGEIIPYGDKFDLIRMLLRNVAVHPEGTCPR